MSWLNEKETPRLVSPEIFIGGLSSVILIISQLKRNLLNYNKLTVSVEKSSSSGTGFTL